MKINFWGVRGSIPVPGETTAKYGGNTSCVSVELDDKIFIFDSGTGIRKCGDYLLSKGGPVQATLFISHTHWDHIQGFPFFVPSYIPGNRIAMYGPPSDIQDMSIKKIMELQTNYEYFPVRISELGATIEYFDCKEDTFEVEGIEVQTCRLNHPVACLAYKLTHNGRVFVYGGDHEPFRNIYRDSGGGADIDETMMAELDSMVELQNMKIVEFLRGADLVIWDSQYTQEEYQTKIGWGHSYYELNLEVARQAGIKHLVCDHHDPMSDDATLQAREDQLTAQAQDLGYKLSLSREGRVIEL